MVDSGMKTQTVSVLPDASRTVEAGDGMYSYGSATYLSSSGYRSYAVVRCERRHGAPAAATLHVDRDDERWAALPADEFVAEVQRLLRDAIGPMLGVAP